MRAVTLDSNLYISALIWGGKPQQLLEMALARKVRLFISDAIMDEVLEVLETKFNHSPKRLALGEGIHRQMHSKVRAESQA